jgi:mercuric ion transport protein
MRELLTGVSGILLSFLASSCCIAPTLFVVFGVSISGLGFLNLLEPYRKVFLLGGYLSVIYSLYRFYFKKKSIECACNEPSLGSRFGKILAWVSLLLLIVASFYPYVLTKIYGG